MKILIFPLLIISQIIFSQAGFLKLGNNINGEATGDESGISVGINSLGNRIAVGGYKNDGNGSNSGHVRIYEDIGGNWIQIGTDIDGETMSDKFGKSIDMNSVGDRVVVGAWFAASASLPIGSGQISCYEFTNGSWNQLGNYINGEATFDYFGISSAINASGNIIAGGAYHNDGINGYNSGHVRVYEYISGVWTQLGNDIDGEAPDDRCGWSVALNNSGYRVAVGSPQNDGNGSNSGSARVYDWNGTSWSQVGSDINGEAVGDHSGNSVSLNAPGNILAIGAIYNQDNGSNSGHVRVYEYIGNSWVQMGGDIDGEAAIDESARSISLDSVGHKIVIGAHANDGNGIDSGHARLYRYLNGSWVKVGDDIDGENADDNCGRSVCLSSNGNRVVIGSPQNDANGSNAGHVRVYKNCTGSSFSIDFQTVCDSYNWNGNIYHQSGVYVDTIPGILTCDSIVTLNLNILQSSSSIDQISYCDSTTWLDGNTYFANNNTATYTMVNSLGCDSIINLDLTIYNSSYFTDTQNACDSLTWIDGNTYYTSNDTATYILSNAIGCDSIVNLDLTIYNSSSTVETLSSCDSLTWIDGVTYTSSNNSAIYNSTSSFGCDSMIILNLTINDFQTNFSESSNSFLAPPFSVYFSNNTPDLSNYSFTWDFGDGTVVQDNSDSVFYEYLYNGNYDVTLVVEDIVNGCGFDTLKKTGIISCTGGPNLSIIENHQSIVLFPNPTKENITVSIGNYHGFIKTEVYDLLGNKLTSFKNKTISLKDFGNGIYLLKIYFGEKMQEIKIIKQE